MTDVKEPKNNVISWPVNAARKERSDTCDSLNAKKRALFGEWLKKGTVMVLFDARSPGVKVPLEYSHQGDLRLNFCYDFHVPDFNFNETGVWASLSFNSIEHFCMVPWSSVYGLQSATLHQGAIWFEDFPDDLDPELVLGISPEELGASAEEEPSFDEEQVEIDNVISVDFAQKSDSLPS